MKKTLTINLWGQVFNIDEDAYEKLQKYLSSLENKFSKTPEGKEIIGDVEARIAEIFREKLATTRQVVTIEDVNYSIEIIGLPEDFDLTNEGATESNEEYKKSEKSKRLYRNPDDRMLGGVGGGLAAYFGIDPVVIRILLVITFFFSGPLIYFLLWIIVPEAKTTAQKLEMRGEPVNLSNIEKNIKDEFNKVKDNIKSKNTKKNIKEITHNLGEIIVSIFHVFFHALRIILGLTFLILGLVFLFSLFVGVFIDGSSTISIGLLINTYIESNLLTPLIIGLCLVMCIPIISLIIIGIRFIFGINKSFKLLRKTLGFSFLMGIILLTFVIINQSLYYKKFNQTSEAIVIDSLKNKTLIINLNDSILNKFNNDELDFNNYLFYCSQDSCKLFGKTQITIQETKDSVASISILKSCRTNKKTDGNIYVRQIPLTVYAIDSVINISKYFSISQKNKFQFQREKININLPVNTKLIINSTEDEYDNISFSGIYSFSEIKGKICVINENGVEPIIK